MTTNQIIDKILDTLPAIEAQSRALDEKHGIDPETSGAYDIVPERILEENPEKNRLVEFLAALPKQTLLPVMTIMYYGRDGAESIQGLKTHLDSTFSNSRVIAHQMIEKRLMLPQYFKGAFDRAEEEGIDLNAI